MIQTGCGVLAEFSWRELFLISIIVIPLVLLYVREPVRQDEEEETGVHNGLEMSRARIKKLYT